MRKRVVFFFLITLFSFTLSQSANALTVPAEAPPGATSLVGMFEDVLTGLMHGTETIIASIGSAIGGLADSASNPTPSTPPASPATAYTAAAAASVAPPAVAIESESPPTSASAPVPTAMKQPVVQTPVVFASPVTDSDTVTRSELSGFLTAFGNLVSLLPHAMSSPTASPSASPNADIVTTQQEIDALQHEISQTNQINTLSNVTLISPTIVGGSLGGSGSSSGGAGSFTSLSISGATTLVDLAATSLAVTGTTTLAGINLASTNCSTFGNGGKLTTDASGNVVCAADQGGSGSTVAGANTQVQFNDGGSFGANSAFTFDKINSRLTVPNASTTNLSVSGNATLGNATSTSFFSAVADFTSGIISILNVSVANIVGFTATNSTTTNATTTNLTISAAPSGFLRTNALGVVSATSTFSLVNNVFGTLGIGFGGTGLSSVPTFGQILVGNAGGGYTLTSTSSLGISSGGGAWGSITGTLANQTDLQTALNGKLSSSSLATSALLAGLVSDKTGSGSLVFATSPTFAGTPVFSGGLINDSVSSTTTIPNGTPYAWTVATSTSANPLIEVDTSGSNGAVSIGAATASSPNIQLGATGQAANLVFDASSTIEGAGTGQLITIGANADVVAFSGSGNVGIGTTTPSKPLTIDSTSASGTAIRISNAATGGHIFDLISTGPGNSGGAGRFDIFDVTSGLARLSVATSGNVGIGTTTPGSIFSINGVANWTTATSTLYSTGGINLTGGCFSINGTCITGGGGGPTYTFSYPLINTANTISLGFGTTTTNSWNSLQTFSAGASTTNLVISNLGNTSTNCLQINNLGQVSSTGSACGGSGSTPGGSSGQIQFNSSNTFGGASNLWWDSSSNRLGIGTSSPYAELSVATPNGASGAVTTLFAIASSTSVGTTTLFSVDNAGNVVSTLAASSTFAVGANGLTNPAFQIFASTTNAANGLALVSSWAGGGVNLNTISSNANEGITINSKGSGNTILNSTSGAIKLQINAASQLVLGSITTTFTPGARSSAAAASFALTTAADTGLTASTEAPEAQFNFGQIHTHLLNANSSGVALNRDFLINAATHTFVATTSVSAKTIADAATFGITGSPIAGLNAFITNANTLELDASSLSASTTNSYGLTVNANIGAQHNYAAEFLGGNVGIGTSTPYSSLEVFGPDAASSTSAFAIVNTSSSTVFAVFDGGNAQLSGTLTQSSDQRLKTNIQDLDGSSSLAEIRALNPVTFNWIDSNQDSRAQFGFIAQQVQGIFPSLVSTTSPTALTPGGTLGLNYIDLISPIIAAIQQLDKELSSLTSTVAGFAQSITTAVLDATTGNFSQVNASELCLGSTCVTQSQLQALLASASQSASKPASSPSDAGGRPPIIAINGNDPAVIQLGATYTDLGATITGPQADLNLGIQTYLNGVFESHIALDTSSAATDTIAYVVTDSQGLTSTSTRIVIIQAPTAPSPAPDSDASTTDDTMPTIDSSASSTQETASTTVSL